MNKLARDSRDPRAATPSRRSQLEALLFAGAAAGTTALPFGGTVDPKLPPFVGE